MKDDGRITRRGGGWFRLPRTLGGLRRPVAGGTAVVLAMGLLSGLGLLAASPAAATTSTVSPTKFPSFPVKNLFPAFPQFKTVADPTTDTDTATLTGNSNDGSPTGTVTFYVCAKNSPTPSFCAPFFDKPTLVGSPVQLSPGNGDTATASISYSGAVPNHYYCFGAIYSGGGSYFPNIDNVWWFDQDGSECFTAGSTTSKTPDTMSGSVNPAVYSYVTSSPPLTDQVTVTGSGSNQPDDGAVTFYLCSNLPAPAECSSTSGTPETAEPPVTTGSDSFTDSSVSISSITPTSYPEWYCFGAYYAGDSIYEMQSVNTPDSFQVSNQCFEIVAPSSPGPSTSGGGGGSSAASGPGLFRLGGVDRIGTAILISQASYGAGKAGAVVLSTSENFPDAVAATPLALKYNAPILLTPPTGLDSRTAAEIKRVLPAGGTVYVLGGTDAISAAVVNAVTALGYTVVRIGGATRFDTAVDIANQVGSITRIFLADGDDYSDVLSAAAASGHPGTVVVLTDNQALPTVTADFLEANPTASVYDIGGPAAAAAPGVTTIVGTDRFQTSALVAQEFFSKPTGAGLATGLNFPDALAAGPFLARNGWPLLLTEPSSLPTSVSQYLTIVKSSLTSVDVLGGVDVVSDSVVQAIDAILGIPTSG